MIKPPLPKPVNTVTGTPSTTAEFTVAQTLFSSVTASNAVLIAAAFDIALAALLIVDSVSDTDVKGMIT